jgi:hypothetical protein
MITTDLPYQDLGPDHFVNRLDDRGKARTARRLVDQLGQLGYHVTLQPAPVPAPG